MRTLTEIKRDYINYWYFSSDTDTIANNERRKKLNEEFVKAMANGVPWEVEIDSPYKGEIKWN